MKLAPPPRVAVRALVVLLAALALPAASACQRSASSPEGSASAAKPAPEGSKSAAPKIVAAAAGSASGIPFAPKKAVWLWHNMADDMTLFFGDRDDLCATLQAEAMPKGATILMVSLKHYGKGTRDLPFGVGEYPVRTGDPKGAKDAKNVLLAKLDDGCRPTAQAKATGGSVKLVTPEAKVGSDLEGTLDLEMEGGGKIAGAFTASWCAPPEDEPRKCK